MGLVGLFVEHVLLEVALPSQQLDVDSLIRLGKRRLVRNPFVLDEEELAAHQER